MKVILPLLVSLKDIAHRRTFVQSRLCHTQVPQLNLSGSPDVPLSHFLNNRGLGT